jgi:protein SCO1/2
MKKQALRSGVVLIIALVVSVGIAFLQISSYRASTEQTVAGIEIGGPFSIVDQHGETFTNKDLFGHYSLIYFGFTSCPAVCPTELQKMNIVFKKLGPAGDKVQPIFITVDPARDTKKVIAVYVAQFSPRLIGLTGTQDQINDVLKAFHVYARRVDDSKLADYTMDHSSYVYWVGPDGRILSLFGPSSTATEIAAVMHKTLNP